MSNYLQAVKRNGGKRCPGEAICRLGKDQLHMLGRRSPGEVDEATGENSPAIICPQCPLFETKPGIEPRHITLAKMFAMEHEEEVANGLRLSHLDDLTPMQWAACRGLSRGRAKYDEWLDENRETNS